MRTVFRWLRRGLLGLLALLLLVLVAAAGLVWWTLPPSAGTLRLAALSAPVEIGFDDHGIPRVRAATERDAWAAMGWLHARDRLFQMEMMRRGASGRLAEIAGSSALRMDRFVRLLGLRGRAEADLAGLPAATLEALEAYAGGVNAYIAERGRFAAPEFLLLGAPEPWRPVDSMLWGKVMGLWLSGNWRTELERARLSSILPVERLQDLWPLDESPGRPDLPELQAASATPAQSAPLHAITPANPQHLARLETRLPRFPVDAPLPSTASNAWVVSGEHTASGAPVLASDPHLGFGAPILWYLARIELPDGRVLAGATAPGVPFVVIGRNERLAWGFTTTHSDTQDVFVERLVSREAYATPDGPRPFEVREETIQVRGAAPVTLRVRETRHGPVLSDLDAPGGPQDGTVLALAMANLAPGDTAAAGLDALNSARSLTEARKAAALITSPSQNLMVADASGGMALYLTGRTPIRRSGDGSMPVPGWDGAFDWIGFAPFDAMPHLENPESGILANANNRVAPADHPVFLGRDWFGDWRFRRLAELLGADQRHTVPQFAAMQTDIVSLFARDTQAFLRRVPRPDGAAGAALDLLLAWDGTMGSHQPQPLIFNAWVRTFGRAALAKAGIPDALRDPSPEFVRFLTLEDERAAAWCGTEGCLALAAVALEQAVTDLASRYGTDPAAWRWEEAHIARFEHPMLRFVPGLGALVRLSAPMAGDGETLLRGAFRGGGPFPFAAIHGAGLRAVFDLSGADGIQAVIATGQSGHPLSPHWDDQLQLWQRGGQLGLGPLQPSGAAATLRLMPRQRGGAGRRTARRRSPRLHGRLPRTATRTGTRAGG